MSSTRSGIFICYSRRDAKALDQLRPFLRPLQRRGLIDFWDDTSLEAGDDWAAGDADAPAVAGLPAAFREAGHRPDVAWLDTRGASAPLLAEVPLVVRRRLREQLRADDNEPVPHLLRRWAPTVVGSGKRAIVWLDWGTFGDGHGEPLKSVDLEAWLSFSSEFLGLNCPHDVRLVSYLAIETPASKHKRLAEVLQQHRRQPWCRRPEFRLSVLPPLGKVAEEDLFDFLEDPQSSSCDPAIHAEVAERLIAETGGEFEPTVALMREAEEGSWYDLLTRLRRSQGEEPSAEEDEPL